jgi:hypothetical protein
MRAEQASLVRLPRSGQLGHLGKGANGGLRNIWQSEPKIGRGGVVHESKNPRSSDSRGLDYGGGV